jgi:hypothetical protein
MLQNINSLFQDLTNPYPSQGTRSPRPDSPVGTRFPFGRDNEDPDPTANGGRTTFTATARLRPRDANRPQGDAHPFADMAESVPFPTGTLPCSSTC